MAAMDSAAHLEYSQCSAALQVFANKALRKKAVEEMQQTHHVINEAQCLRDMVRSCD
jgi:hypothetical protein